MFLPISSSHPAFFSPQEKPSSSPSSQFELQHPILRHPHDSIGQPGSFGQNLDGMEARGSVRALALWVGVRTHVKWVWLVSECPHDRAGTYPAVRHTPCKSHYGSTHAHTQSSRNVKYAGDSWLYPNQVQLKLKNSLNKPKLILSFTKHNEDIFSIWSVLI